jgi:diguanylate cyclase
MITVLASMGTLLTLNLLFAAIALGVGFAAGVWFFGADSVESTPPPEPRNENSGELQLAAERAMMASQRIQDLAKTMVADVGSHATKVEAINTEMQAFAEKRDGEGSEAIFDAIGRMIDANNELQNRLVQAEKHIEAQAAELRSYETEARTDSLTGLANRRAFDDEMERRLAEWDRVHSPFTLLILDIDHFKQFNDCHGHPAGDEVLRAVGRVLVATARQDDLPCRYGGEEFAAILGGTEIREARAAAERFRKAIETTVVKFDGKQLSITCSIGLAQIGLEDDQAQLIRRADEALYKSKESGRNCGHFHDGERSLPVVGNADPAKTPSKSGGENAGSIVELLISQDQFLDILNRRVAESHRFGIPLSVMHLRVDDYATLRQTYGKSVASMVLESVAQFTQSALRQMDVLGRLDDGEFAVLLPGSTLSEGTQVGKRLQTAAANCSIPIENQKSALRLSHGISQLRPNETAGLLMARARSGLPADGMQKQPTATTQ